jgi:cyclophilin family peptidyl-prolyl cis-trans isomerase
MEENPNKAPIGVYATLIITIIILGTGYYVWKSSSSTEEPIKNEAASLNATGQLPEPPQLPVPPAPPQPPPPPVPALPQSLKNLMHTVTIETNKGTIVFETYDADAPKTAKNFVDLVNKGFYNGTIFHRVIPGFMIQGGDPTGTGSGGPGYQFEDELNPATASYKDGYKRGVVAMANAGPNTNGSQFFIMHADYPLPHSYTIFGRVVKGIEVVDAISSTKTGAQDRPVEKIVMNKVTVMENK